MKCCVNAYLFYQVKRQDLQGKQLLSTNEKYYIADHGIREAIYGGNMKDIHLILENIVYMELLRRGYNITVGKVKDKEIKDNFLKFVISLDEFDMSRDGIKHMHIREFLKADKWG